MIRLLFFLTILTILGTFAPGSSVQACPNCKEAIASAGEPEDDDPLREARAYNYSIYLMVGMPYLLLGTAGLVIYRTVRSAQKKVEQTGGGAEPAPPA
jgi:hypothetical protein